MPVNMDPKKKKKPASEAPSDNPKPVEGESKQPKGFGETTDRDKELALADAEWKNLWDATEVIDMDKW